MADRQGASSEPQRSAPRWPSPTPRSPHPPSPSPSLDSTTSQDSQKSLNSTMQDLLKKAKDYAANKPKQPPPPTTFIDLITQEDPDTQFKDKLITNPSNGHHFKTFYNIGSSGTATRVFNGIYWVNDANELETMAHYDIYVSVKVTNTEDQEAFTKLADQIVNTRALNHPNLLKVKEEMVVEDKFWVVFPLMDGSLRCLLKSIFSNGISEDLIAIVLKEILEALAYLHQRGHLHQELNASHIYYNCHMPAIKIGYLATIYEHNSDGSTPVFFRGPPPPLDNICQWAAAPEIYYSTEEYSEKSDVWLVGIIALELAFGGIQEKDRRALELWIADVTRKEKGYIGKGKAKVKAMGKSIKKLMSKMKIGKAGSSSSSMSRAFKNLLALCLTVDPEERPTAAALLQHDFFKICDGTFDVYEFRNAVESAKKEIEMLVGTSETNAAGTSSGTNAAGTSSGANAAGTSSGANAPATSSGTNAAGTTAGGSVAGTSAGGTVASAGGTVAGTSAGGSVADTSAGGNVAGPSAGGNAAEGAKP